MAESSKGSRLKDLVVTAAVASVVSALVHPWLRRWLEPGAFGMRPPQPVDAPPAADAHEEFAAQLRRLLEVPDPFSPAAIAAFGAGRERGNNTNTRSEVDDEEDLEP